MYGVMHMKVYVWGYTCKSIQIYTRDLKSVTFANVTLLRSRVAMWLYGYMARWLYGYMVVLLYGYMAIWLGYVAVWLYGCMAV